MSSYLPLFASSLFQIGEADLAQQFRDKVKPTLQNWLDGTAANPLLYDGMWGGLVSTNGLTDPGADFGLGYYQVASRFL